MKINLTTEQKEIIIRKGEALPPKADKSISINGTLSAPFQFLQGKEIDDRKTHLQIRKDIGTLELHIQDTDPYTEHVITGSLKRDSVLQQFKINSDHRWSVREFVKFVKTMRFYFSDKEAHQKLIESLQKWNVMIEKTIKDHNDSSGNSLLMLETKVRDVQLVNKFNLNVPIFQGYPKQTFTVEIGLDPKNTAVDLYLISDELIELEIGVREYTIATELKNFDSFEFSKVVVS